MHIQHGGDVPGSVASLNLDWQEALAVVRLESIRLDLVKAKGFAREIERHLAANRTTDATCEGVTWAALMLYARCFTEARGRKTVLHSNEVAAALEDDLRSLHLGLMQRRHETFAHAGEQSEHTATVHLVRTGQRLEVTFSSHFISPAAIVDPDQARLLIQLIERVLELVDRKGKRAFSRFARRARREKDDLVGRLKDAEGTFATNEQLARYMMEQMFAES